MKTLIVGAGIIGSIHGWAFAEAGHEVLHLVRSGKSAQYVDGINIDMYDVRKGHKRDFIGCYPIRLTETLQPTDGYELVIVPTKHYHLLETLSKLFLRLEALITCFLRRIGKGRRKLMPSFRPRVMFTVMLRRVGSLSRIH